MKVLYLIRHAKSGWDYPVLKDIDRPLTRRGMKNAKVGASILAALSSKPEELISSPAKRAYDTAEFYHQRLGIALKVNENLYTFNSTHLHFIIASLSPNVDCTALIGHEPAISGVVNAMLKYPLEKIPTASITKLVFEAESWTEVLPSNFISGMHYNRHHWDGFNIH